MRARRFVGALAGAAILTGAATTAVTAPASAAIPSGYVALKVANLNTDFGLDTSTWRLQMNRLAAQKAHVITVQETQWRDAHIKKWAKTHGYSIAWGKNDAQQESTVLWKPARFKHVSTSYRLGSPAVKRAIGDTIGARYIATVRLIDKTSGRRIAFSSTHAVPEVMWWPDQASDPKAPKPYAIKPRVGTSTLHAYKRHMLAIKAQVAANKKAGYLTGLGGDFNVGYEYEAAWTGFQTTTFGAHLVSNHRALGQVPTYSHGKSVRSIDYVYAQRTPHLKFIRQAVTDVESDHHQMVVNFAVKKAAKR